MIYKKGVYDSSIASNTAFKIEKTKQYEKHKHVMSVKRLTYTQSRLGRHSLILVVSLLLLMIGGGFVPPLQAIGSASRYTQTKPSQQQFARIDVLARGDTLTGRTRMGDNVMVDFRLTVLSIFKNAAPETDSILAVIEDKLFEETGVLAGMSGSPVYYEDKLIGAVAYTVSFLKKPIVGVTPIAAMLPIIDYEQHPNTQRERAASQFSYHKPTLPQSPYNPNQQTVSAFIASFTKTLSLNQKSSAQPYIANPSASLIGVAPNPKLPNFFEPMPNLSRTSSHAGSSSERNSRFSQFSQLRPIAMPLAINGAFYLNEKLLTGLSGMENFVLTPSGGLQASLPTPRIRTLQSSIPNNHPHKNLQALGEQPPKNEQNPKKHTPQVQKSTESHQHATQFSDLVPGDLIGVNLVRGSLNISSFGTVTYTDGTQLLAFGHPMNLLGTTDLSLYTGFVDAVVPRLDFSYKVGRLLTEVGAIRQDRSPGILGVKDVMTPRLPIRVTLKTPVTEQALYFEVIRTRPFVEQFTSLVLLNSFVQFEGLGGNTTFRYALNIENIEGDQIQIKRTLLYGAVRQNLFLLSGYLNTLLTTMIDNPFATVPLKEINLALTRTGEEFFSFLEHIHYPKHSFIPGATVTFLVTFKDFQGTTYTQDFSYTLPKIIENGNYTINLANEVDFIAEDLQVNAERYAPHDLQTLFKLLSLSPQERTLVIWMTAPQQTSLKLKSQSVYPKLPSIKYKLLSELPQTGTTVLREFATETESLEKPILGFLKFPIKIVNP